MLLGFPASTALISRLNLYSWFSLSSFLRGVFEGALHEWWHVVFVVVLSLGSVLLGIGAQSLEGLVLLGTDLLEDLGQHACELFGLRGAGHDQQVLTDRELD